MAESQSTTAAATSSAAKVNGRPSQFPGAGFHTKGKYKGLHWTQTPAGKKKMAAAAKRGHITKRKMKTDVRKGRSYNGKHWTQTPEGKAKLSRSMRLAHQSHGQSWLTKGKDTSYSRAKRQVVALALIGARQQLAFHQAQVTRLKLFLSTNSRLVGATPENAD